MITIERKVTFGHGRRGRKEIQGGDAKPATSVGRVPRVSRIMAYEDQRAGRARRQ